MTIRHIRTFLEVCRQGGVTRAAQNLCVAQPSVSQAIAELEGYYGVRLFERVGRKLILTPEGEKLKAKATEVVAEFDSFEAAATAARATPSVRIGASMTAGKIVIPRLICAIQSHIEGVECRALVDSTAAIVSEISGGGLDFAIVEGSISGDIEAKEWGSDRLAAVCAPSAPLPQSADGASLVKLPLLLRLRGSASRDLLDSRFSERGLSCSPVVQSSSNSALIAAAEEGLGVAVLPFALVERHILRGQLREIALVDLNLRRTWFAVWRRGKKFSPAQKRALDICMNRQF